MHSDHTIGYPDLIFTPWVMGRSAPLDVYGPAGHVLRHLDSRRGPSSVGEQPEHDYSVHHR